MESIEQLARDTLEALRRGEGAWVAERLSEQLKPVLTEERLKGTWDQVAGTFGAFRHVAQAQVTSAMGSDQAVLTCEAESGKFTLSITTDQDGMIASLNVMPAVDHPRPSYAPPEDPETHDLTFHADERYPLPGTLTLPAQRDGAVPTVVLVHGSGPNDRDERLMGAAPFLDLALGLAASGIASFRYDKRTRVHKLGNDISLDEEVIDDAVAAVSYVRGRDGVDRSKVFVLGHSLGATLAPAIAVRDPSIAGLVILAGATRDIADILDDQVNYILSVPGASTVGGAPPGQLEQVLEQTKALRTATLDTPAELLPMKMPARYWLSWRERGPLAVVGEVSCPMLILQGERDYQVVMEDFEGWRRAIGDRANVTLRSYPDLNHLFATGTGKSTPIEYLQQSNVDETVVADIASWVHATR